MEDVIEMPEAGVNEVPAAEEQSSGMVETNDKTDVAFSKRLSSAQEKWNAEKEKEIQAIKDQYKDHDVYKHVAEYTRKANNMPDMLTVKQEIELQELQERSEEAGLSPAQQKEMEELRSIKDQWNEMKSQSEQQKEIATFEASLKTFVEGKELDGKPVDHQELWKFMHENNVGNPDIAFKAMKADLLESKLATANEDAVKNYLASKSGVRTKGDGLTAQSLPVQEKGFKGVENRLIEQLRANKQNT